MSQLTPFNITNAVANQSNVFNYVFPSGSVSLRDMECAISNMLIPYDWYSISAAFGNNTVSLIFPTGATTATLNITIPDGFYTIEQLNAYLQSVMITNNYYMINNAGPSPLNVYYLEIVANENTGKAQLNCYQVPTTVPGDFINPGWTLPTTVNQVPRLVVSNTEFGKVIGFELGTYPSTPTQLSTYSIQSTSTPQISPVSSIYVCLSCVNNFMSSPNNIVSVIPLNNTYGGQITYAPPEYIWIDTLQGSVNAIQLTLYDQNMRPLRLNDVNVIGNVIFRVKRQ
jgi:hypothetical protein